MSFWANKVGIAPAPQPVVQQPSNQPWWVPRAPVQQQPVYIQQSAPPVTLDSGQQVSVPPPGEYHIGDLLRQDGYTTEKAQSAKDGETCPECSSPNYMGVRGVPNAMKQCYNCGFNPRFAHTTAGASGIGQQNVAAPKPARVQNVSIGAPPMNSLVGRV